VENNVTADDLKIAIADLLAAELSQGLSIDLYADLRHAVIVDDALEIC
jgi:hypothetical protein